MCPLPATPSADDLETGISRSNTGKGVPVGASWITSREKLADDIKPTISDDTNTRLAQQLMVQITLVKSGSRHERTFE